jgi:hypothetical protein
MAVTSNVLIGKTSGSVGGTTFSSWKGINVFKSKPTIVANPNTDAQKVQRAAMAYIVAIYRIMVAVLSLGFKEMAVGKSAFNAFTSQNVKKAMDLSNPPTPTFTPATFKVSKGTISDTAMTSVVADKSDATVLFTYPNTAALPGQSATDKPLMAVFNETKLDWISKVGTATRNTGSDSIAIPAAWDVADVLHCYCGFVNASGASASDSVYNTVNIIA